jgi:hypothetical protein
VSEQAKREEKVIVVVIKYAPRSIFLEGKSTAKLGIHPQHVIGHYCLPHEQPYIYDHYVR